MGKVIYYNEYALSLCAREEKFHDKYGFLNPKISKRIEKLFQWDRILNLLG